MKESKKNSFINIISFIILILIVFFVIKSFNIPDKLKADVGNLIYENNNITLRLSNVEEEEGNIKLLYDKDSKVEVTIKFDEKIKKGEKIEITLNEGMKFSSLPLKEIDANDNFEYDVLIENNEILYGAISSTSTENIIKEENNVTLQSGYKSAKTSVYGTVVYNLKEGLELETLTISFNISSDMFRFYGEHIIKDAISVKFGDDIITKDIKLHSNDTFGYSSNVIDQYPFSKGVFASYQQEIRYGNSLYVYNSIEEKNDFPSISGLPKYKSIVYDLHYPKYTSFDSLITYDLSGKGSSVEIKTCNLGNDILVDSYVDAKNYFTNNNIGCTENDPIFVIDYPSQNKIKVIATNNVLPGLFSIKYKVNDLNGINELKDAQYIEEEFELLEKVTYEFYDGEKQEFRNATNSLKKVKIWNPNTKYNSLTYHEIYTPKDSFHAYEDMDDNTFIYGPSVGIENIYPREITNQTIEYEIDENYQVVGVSFPRKNGIKVKDIKYKVYGNCTSCGKKDNDGWYSYGNLDKKLDVKFTILDAGITEENVYFAAVKGVVESYDVDYNSKGGAASGQQNLVLYGNLKSTAKEASINYYIYSDSRDRNNEASKLTKYVYREEEPSVSILEYTNSKYKFDKKTIKTGENFVLTGGVSAYNYPYGTRMYIKDVIIYIREPKDFSLNVNDVRISYINENGIEELYCEATECINNKNKIERNNDTIYVINTGKSVGFGLTKKERLNETSRELKIQIPYKTNLGINVANIETNDLLSINSKEKVKFVQYFSKEDKYDIDNDSVINEIIPKLGSEKLTIQKTESFVARSSITKNGEVYGPYNEENPFTIIDVVHDDIYEYNLKLINNTSKAAKFSIYVPVPKLGNNYGEKYQEHEFLWSSLLLEKIKYEDDELFEFSYSTSKTFDKNSFKTNISNDSLKNVTMIKITSKKEIPIEKEYNIKIKFKIDDKNFDSKSNLLNIWNPVSFLEAESLTGEFIGEKTAMKLNYKEISGLVYLDINKNKLYDEGIDIPGVRDINIDLYRKNEESYEFVSKIEADILSGEFSLKDLTILTNDIYALKLTSEIFNCNSDIVLEGWIKDIDFTKNKKNYYEIGYITDEFAPKIKAEDAYIYVGDKIEFEKYIIEAYDYKKEKIEFEFGKNGNTTYSSDIPNNNAIATKVGIYYATYDVTDKYGNKASALIKIYVRERPLPPSTNDDITKYIVIGILSLITIILSFIIFKKIKTNK